jgi:hypothetical protein
MTDHTRPLALWGLISTNLFTEQVEPDFYLNLVAFFEPFIEEKNGQIVDIDALKEYARIRLMLTLSNDVAEIFASQMRRVGWLQEISTSESNPLYRCKFSGKPLLTDDYKQYDERLSTLIRQFIAFISDQKIALNRYSPQYIEDGFIAFLIKQFISDNDNFSSTVISDDSQLEYWIAKFIARLNINDKSTFEFIQKIAGVFLLADVIIEIGNPSQDTKGIKDLLVFLDGPLVMNYLGLAGQREKDNVSFALERLRGAGATVACFKHSCDEIRDNLTGLFARAPQDRTGPSAEAVRKGEVREMYLASVRNNVEHFVEKVAKIEVVHAQLNQYEYAKRYCDDVVYQELIPNMPSQSSAGRERDAASIAIIMRRRGGHESSQLKEAKFLLVTSSETLVRRANEVLRENRVLGGDRSVIGPAIHQRVVAGLVFANFGLTEKQEISRRQLLAACARVVMLRPRVLERLRQQIGLLNRPEDAAIVDALLSQPRASEIIMDHSIGLGRPISPSNIEETIAAIREAGPTRKDYGNKVDNQPAGAAQAEEQRSREHISTLQAEKQKLETRLLYQESQNGNILLRVKELGLVAVSSG